MQHYNNVDIYGLLTTYNNNDFNSNLIANLTVATSYLSTTNIYGVLTTLSNVSLHNAQ
jgi:hypothetical protein